MGLVRGVRFVRLVLPKAHVLDVMALEHQLSGASSPFDGWSCEMMWCSMYVRNLHPPWPEGKSSQHLRACLPPVRDLGAACAIADTTRAACRLALGTRSGHTATAMRLTGVIWLREVVEKLAWKHNVTTDEVEEALASARQFRFIERGDVDGEDLYAAMGQSAAGRYLISYFVYKTTGEGLIISARDMTRKEKRLYAKT